MSKLAGRFSRVYVEIIPHYRSQLHRRREKPAHEEILVWRNAMNASGQESARPDEDDARQQI